MGRREKPFNDAFSALSGLKLPQRKPEEEKPPPPKIERVEEQGASDEELFRRAVAGTRKIERDIVPGAPRRERAVVHDDEAEVMAELADLVSGRSPFDTSWTDEHIEGIHEGLDRKLLRKLRKGAFSTRAHIDLHGKTRREAKDVVERFLRESRRQGHRCVLIIHGRGLHSEDSVPVLKDAVGTWLMRGRISREVLAFCSARPSDGGAGAIYVLLRK